MIYRMEPMIDRPWIPAVATVIMVFVVPWVTLWVVGKGIVDSFLLRTRVKSV